MLKGFLSTFLVSNNLGSLGVGFCRPLGCCVLPCHVGSMSCCLIFNPGVLMFCGDANPYLISYLPLLISSIFFLSNGTTASRSSDSL